MEINAHDKDLQQKIADGTITDGSIDDRAYRTVFSAASREPSFQLPDSFANRVAAMAAKSIAQHETRRERWIYALGMLSIVAAFVAALATIDFSKFRFNPGVGVFTFVSANAGLVIFGVVFVAVLHLIDRFFLRASR